VVLRCTLQPAASGDAAMLARRKQLVAVLHKSVPAMLPSLARAAALSMPAAAAQSDDAQAAAGAGSAVAVAAMDAMCVVVERKEVMLLSGADVALMLDGARPLVELAARLEAELSARQQQGAEGRVAPFAASAAASWGRGGATERITALCALISALLKHNPKQTYLVLPSLMTVLRAMFSVVLCGFGRTGDDAEQAVTCSRHVSCGACPPCPPPARAACCALRCRLKANAPARLPNAPQLARLCEQLVPHKNAVSKHVVPPLAHFVHVAASSGLMPALRRALLPGIFYLLDVCSKFELQQLHVAVDGAGQAVLKTVRSEYDEEHKYKGKF